MPPELSEHQYMRRAMVDLSTVGTVWRNNTGVGWQGTRLKVYRGAPVPTGIIVLKDARPLEAGLCPGSSDLIQITPMEIRPEHLGTTIGVFTAIEVKGPRTALQANQRVFLNHVAANGGISILARSGKDGLARFIEQAKRGEVVGGRIYGALPGT